jgi:imidazoleglycerol phosphate dehydratase HisB
MPVLISIFWADGFSVNERATREDLTVIIGQLNHEIYDLRAKLSRFESSVPQDESSVKLLEYEHQAH